MLFRSQIYCSGTDVARQPFNASVPAEYAIQDNRLYLYSAQGNCKIRVRPGKVYTVDFTKSPPGIYRAHPPAGVPETLMWLLGLSDRKRARTLDHYRNTLEFFRSTQRTADYEEHHISGEGYEFVVFTYSDSTEICPVVGYISNKTEVTPDFVKTFLCLWPYQLPFPASYVKNILHQRLHLSRSDWRALTASNPRLFPEI